MEDSLLTLRNLKKMSGLGQQVADTNTTKTKGFGVLQNKSHQYQLGTIMNCSKQHLETQIESLKSQSYY
jgi:hypothetical protein